MKRITILGSTGSIGRNVLEVINTVGEEFEVVALSTYQNISLLEEQIKKFSPSMVAVKDEEKGKILKSKFPHLSVLWGEEGILEIARKKVDLVVVAIVGMAALLPTREAIKAGNDLALANKEIVVSTGERLMEEVKKRGVRIFPLDSEHSAIFQILEGKKKEEVEKIILTASGGPFYHCSSDQLYNLSVEEALRHPVWKMGKKITIDSATLMNKGFEVITAHWLFNLDWEKIQVLIHPQAMIHAIVEMRDGFSFALLATPDMKGPIQYVLTYPQRRKGLIKKMKWEELTNLSFFLPDEEKFPALRIAREAGKKGMTYPAVLNAANEVCVQAFLEKKIKFPHIWEISQRVLSSHRPVPNPDWDKLMEADRWGRQEAWKLVEEYEKVTTRSS